MNSELALSRTLDANFLDVAERTIEALKKEGFGIVSTIDVNATLQAKIGKEIGPYTIFGACNPTMAHKALTIDPGLGVFLPCNVVVRQVGPGITEVRVVDPLRLASDASNPELHDLASQVREMLGRVVASI